MVPHKDIRTFVAIFMIIGVFGNVNVIVAIARKKILRTKNLMFVLFLSIGHLGCNISELISVVMQYRSTPMSRRNCYNYNIIYSFFWVFQSSLYLIIAHDLCFSVVLPLKHKIWNKSRYVLAMLTFPITFSIFLNILGTYKLSDEIEPFCIFVVSPDPSVYRILISLIVVCNMTTLIIIIISVCIALNKSKSMGRSRHSKSSKTGSFKKEKNKVFRSTFFMVIIHMGSWIFATCTFKILVSITNEENTIDLLCYLNLIVLPNFCQTYFVFYFRSPRLRKAFQEQLNWMSYGKLFPTIFKNHKKRVKPVQSCNNNHNESKKLLELETSIKLPEYF